MDYVAIVTIELNGTTYHKGDIIAPADVPTAKLRSLVDKGLLDAVNTVGDIADGSIAPSKITGTAVVTADSRLTLTGTGQPNGVVTGTVGQKYVDTAATAGAVEWTKMSGSGNTGWVCSVGDTGWRQYPQQDFTATGLTGQSPSSVSYSIILHSRQTAAGVALSCLFQYTTTMNATAGSAGAWGVIPSGFPMTAGSAGVNVYADATSPSAPTTFCSMVFSGRYGPNAQQLLSLSLSGSAAARLNMAKDTWYAGVATAPLTLLVPTWPTELPGSAATHAAFL